MILLNPSKSLFDLANDEAKKLQEKQGRDKKGIISTQVQGLIIALVQILDKFPDLAKIERIRGLDPKKSYIIKVPSGFTPKDYEILRNQLKVIGIKGILVPFDLEFIEKK